MALLFGFFFSAAIIMIDKENGWEALTFEVARRVSAPDAEFSASAGRVAGGSKHQMQIQNWWEWEAYPQPQLKIWH